VRVVVFAAHPDDEVLGMGGTIAAHASAGDAVRIVCVTDGSSTQYPGDADVRARKNEEARRAAAELGVDDYVHLDLPDMRLDTLPHVDVNRVVEEHVHDFRPDVVYTPHPDVNLDHRALFDSVAVATRAVPGQTVRRVLTYAPTSSTEWTPAGLNWFVPNWFVDVTETFERKLAAWKHYETEARDYPHPRSERALRAHAEYYGASVGVDYAEPFVLIRNLR
jgi:LmbE family N-acetylglucosaminyl deacetylase